MKKTTDWILKLYLLVAVADILTIIFGIHRYYTKPLLMPLLLWFVWTHAQRKHLSLLLLALFFSFLGDFALMFSDKTHFLLGLGCFLIAHIHYCLFFYKLHRLNPQTWSMGLIACLSLYLFATNVFLFPYLGDLKIPVLLYGLVLGAMLVLANQAQRSTQQKEFLYGALLFMLSDSLLGLNLFYVKGNMVLSVLVMLTYLAAQYLLVRASVRMKE